MRLQARDAREKSLVSSHEGEMRKMKSELKRAEQFFNEQAMRSALMSGAVGRDLNVSQRSDTRTRVLLCELIGAEWCG
jgi:hypothetical protein